MISRRDLLAGAGAGLLLRTSRSTASGAARVVVIGGGFAGAAFARRLHQLEPQAQITLIERRRSFYTGPLCNTVVAGLEAAHYVERSSRSLGKQGIRYLEAEVIEIDPVAKRVRTAQGHKLQADFIVVAPGVAMRWDAIEGLDQRSQQAQPHAWLGDAQLTQLAKRVAALEDGAVVAIASPPNPYRCPPGPYERASLIAWALQQRGHKRSKILILDAKDDFTKKPLFEYGWDLLYPGMVQWHSRSSGGTVVATDPQGHWLRTGNGERVNADLSCVIPPQRAGDIAAKADLADETLWCPVHAQGLESKRHAGVYVIGDAAAIAPVPKSAFAAHSQAQLCALTIAARLRGDALPEPRLINTCYSVLAPNYAISVSAVYAPADAGFGAQHSGMSPLQGDAALRESEYHQAREWYAHITQACFG